MNAISQISDSAAPQSFALVKPQRTQGQLQVTCTYKNGKTSLATLRQSGASKIRFPALANQSHLEGILINTAGGLTGGDSLELHYTAEANTHNVLTTQACEKIYKSAGGDVSITNRFDVSAQAKLHWIPQETILFDKAKLSREIIINAEKDADIILFEAVLLGRKYKGESFNKGHLKDRWKIYVDRRLIHLENIDLNPGRHALVSRARLGQYGAYATLFILGDKVEPLKHALCKYSQHDDKILCAASNWTVGDSQKIIVRLMAIDGYELRKKIIPILKTVLGSDIPKIWTN